MKPKFLNGPPTMSFLKVMSSTNIICQSFVRIFYIITVELVIAFGIRVLQRGTFVLVPHDDFITKINTYIYTETPENFFQLRSNVSGSVPSSDLPLINYFLLIFV